MHRMFLKRGGGDGGLEILELVQPAEFFFGFDSLFHALKPLFSDWLLLKKGGGGITNA